MDEKKYGWIIRNYRRFFVFVFSYFILLVALGVAWVFFQRYFLNPTYQWEHTDPFFLQKNKLIWNFEHFLQQAIQDTDMRIIIMQWPLTTADNFILSQDNLIQYKGFIVPKYFSIATTLPIKPITYFDNNTYDTGELALFINNIILTRKFITTQPNKNIQLPLQDTLTTTFNLKCLSQRQIYPDTCAYYIKNFLSSFFVYRLSTDYTWLLEIFTQLQNKQKYRDLACQNIEKYVLYSNDQNRLLKPIFEQCGEASKTFFKRMELFIDIQKQLDDKLINSDTYSDSTLNTYKLFSVQQMIYNDILEQRMSINQYTLYLDFVKELLQKNLLSGFYLDEIYRFDTYYLKPTLQAIRSTIMMGGDKENKINLVVKNIDTLNFGDVAFGFTWLHDRLINRALLANLTPLQEWSGVSLEETIMQKLKGLSYMEISNTAITDNQILLSGYFLIDQKKIPTTLTLFFQSDVFLVHSILLPSYPSLGDTLQALLTKQALSIWDFFATLSKNLPLYEVNTTAETTSKTLCDGVKDLQTSLGIQMTTCTTDQITIQKIFDATAITYNFLLENSIIDSINISDAAVQTYIQNFFQQHQYTNLTVIDAIKTIINATPNALDIAHEGTINTIIVLQDFQKYLNNAPNDIAEKSGKLLLDFTLKNVNFIAGYDVTNHVLAPRYFKNIIGYEKPLIIKNLKLVLDDDHQDDITLFINDPIWYIKNVDMMAWRNYVSQNK